MGLFKRNNSIVLLAEQNRQFAATIAPGSRVLDAGAGEAPYRSFFEHTQYETADFQKIDKPYAVQNYICDLASIPVENNYFDHIVFNQVMEHLPDPASVLLEFNRVLKPGGTIICSCPFFFEEHEVPHDYYRYTQFGHRHLFETAGFRVDKTEWLEGYFGTVSHQLRRMERSIPIADRRILTSVPGLLALPFILLLRGIAAIGAPLMSYLDLYVRISDRGYPINYVTTATKTDTPLAKNKRRRIVN